MAVVFLEDWRRVRNAWQLAQVLSGDPQIRAAARVESLKRLTRIQRLATGGTPGEGAPEDELRRARERAREQAEIDARRAARAPEEND
jgi:hypothetical protein